MQFSVHFVSMLHLFRALCRALGKIEFTAAEAAAHNLLDSASDAMHIIMVQWLKATFALNIKSFISN